MEGAMRQKKETERSRTAQRGIHWGLSDISVSKVCSITSRSPPFGSEGSGLYPSCNVPGLFQHQIYQAQALAWWYSPVIPALGRLKQEVCDFKAS
jgi:hypothetical protein